MNQNKHRPSDPIAHHPNGNNPPPPTVIKQKSKSKPITKPISKKQSHLHRFGTFFSKSPKLTTNRLQSSSSSASASTASKPRKHEEKEPKALLHHHFADNYLSAAHKRASNANSTEIEDSTPNSMEEDNTALNGVLPPRVNRQSTRYRELMKEYVDTESTVSSSDIQDDISSIASDDVSSSYSKRPPRIAPPPPPHARPPPLPIPRRNSQHIKSKSLNTTPVAKAKEKQKQKHKHKHKSRIEHIEGFGGRKRSEIKLSPTEVRNNPYINAIDFGTATGVEKKATKHIGLPPPPLSPTHAQNAASMMMKIKRPQSANSFKSYRSRIRHNNLPHYEIPSQLVNNKSKSKVQLPQLHKSHSANAKAKAKPKRHASEDITHQNNRDRERDNARLVRSNSARVIDDLSLSEKIYQNRRTVLHRLRGKKKGDVMSKLDISIGKVEQKLKVYVRNLVSLQDELQRVSREEETELSEWESINNFSLTNLCRSYYSNSKLLISIRIEIATKYCECFRDKYRQLKKTRDRIKKDARKFNLDDLVLTVEAAMMSASNIRLPSDIKLKRENETALKGVIAELKKKYAEKKYEDVVAPMSLQDRTKHILTMLVQIIDTSNKNETKYESSNVSDGLPYFHPIDNGYQVPFEQLLYDPRFEQKGSIDAFIARYTDTKIIDKEKLSLTKISTFIYKLTNSFLNSCQLNRDSPHFEKLFWDCTNLMIGRSIFPKFSDVIQYVCRKDTSSIEADEAYKKQLIWMSKLQEKQMGIEAQFTHITDTSRHNDNNMSSIFIDDDEEKIAYYRPIKRLKGLKDISVPQDSIVLVIDSIHDIQKCAIKYAKIHNTQNNVNQNEQIIISGDSLFPIVVYCLVQSNVVHWNQWMFMMRKFYTQRILSFGQTGFCFSIINAAVAYILEQKPHQFY